MNAVEASDLAQRVINEQVEKHVNKIKTDLIGPAISEGYYAVDVSDYMANDVNRTDLRNGIRERLVQEGYTFQHNRFDRSGKTVIGWPKNVTSAAAMAYVPFTADELALLSKAVVHAVKNGYQPPDEDRDSHNSIVTRIANHWDRIIQQQRRQA